MKKKDNSNAISLKIIKQGVNSDLYTNIILGYKKRATIIFAEVKQFVQCLQSAVTKHWTIWDSITLVVAFDSLYNDFKLTTAPLLYSGDKDIVEIQQIVTFTEAANMARQTTGWTTDLAMQMKKSSDGHQ